MQVMQASFGAPLSTLYGRRFALAVASPNDACSPLNNSTPVNGTIVLIQRGACFMSTKVKWAIGDSPPPPSFTSDSVP